MGVWDILGALKSVYNIKFMSSSHEQLGILFEFF